MEKYKFPPGAIQSWDEIDSMFANMPKPIILFTTDHQNGNPSGVKKHVLYSKDSRQAANPNYMFCDYFVKEHAPVIGFGRTSRYGYVFTNYWFALAHQLRDDKSEDN